MKPVLTKYKVAIAFFVMLFVTLLPIRSFAHDSYFLQVLIDDHKYIYSGNIVSETGIVNEAKHVEYEMGGFGNLKQDVRPLKGKYADGASDEEKKKDIKEAYEDYAKKVELNKKANIFSFNPYEIQKWYGAAKNHATGKDADKAYFTQETLITSLNDALKVVNGGKEFTSVKQLMVRGNHLAMAINGSYTFKNYTVKKGRAYDTAMPKGITEDDYITITNNKTKPATKYEFIYKVQKGYKGAKDEDGDVVKQYESDTEALTWHQLMFQANYAYAVHGYTLATGQEINKPSALEEMIVDMLENLFNQLRNILGLYEINELVFNDGIRGSHAFTHGVMATDWSDKAQGFHWLFQGFAWSIIIFAIVKNLLQRNLATINPAMRISLIQSIQDLLITGLILASSLPIMNMLMFLNFKIVDVFGATAPDFGDLSGMNGYSGMLGGILIQFFYFGISIYLNFVYIMRAITLSILIASAPLFIVSIAFGGKWKQLFWTWMREFVGNLYLQSFHAFALSFFFAISTSSRGIESIIVMMALIPLTEFFRTMVMGGGGGISHSLGMNSISAGAGMVSGALSSKSKPKGPSDKGGGGSGREVSSSENNDSGMSGFAGNSDKIKNNSENMTQRQRMNSTKEANANRDMPLNMTNEEKKSKFSTDDLNTSQSVGQKIRGKLDNAVEKKNKFTNAVANSPATKITGGAVKATTGVGKAVVGTSMALAMGMENPNLAYGAMRTASEGIGDIKGGVSNMGQGVVDSFPESTSDYMTTLPNGDIQVHRNAQNMAEQGVVGATMEGTKNEPIAKYTYDVNKLKPEAKESLRQAHDAFLSGDKNAIAHYKSQGIENVTKTADNNLVVRYNKTGMEAMGIKSVQTVGKSGANARIVETKASDAPNTLRTIPLKPYVPQEQATVRKREEEDTNTREFIATTEQPKIAPPQPKSIN